MWVGYTFCLSRDNFRKVVLLFLILDPKYEPFDPAVIKNQIEYFTVTFSRRIWCISTKDI